MGTQEQCIAAKQLSALPLKPNDMPTTGMDTPVSFNMMVHEGTDEIIPPSTFSKEDEEIAQSIEKEISENPDVFIASVVQKIRPYETLTDMTSINVFLKTYGRHPLLSKEDEQARFALVEYGKMIRGTYVEEQLTRGKKRTITKKRLQQAVFEEQQAMETILGCNIRLVVSVVRRYMGFGFSFEDLLQEGHMGLERAAKKFDYHRGNRFSTYATWWIRQALTRYVEKNRTSVHVPVGKSHEANEYAKFLEAFRQEHGKKPSIHEAATVLGKLPKNIRGSMAALQTNHVVSLDAPARREHDHFDDDKTIGEILPEDKPSVENQVDRLAIRNILQKTLTTQEWAYVAMAYGERWTCEEIHQKLGIPKSEAIQLGIAARKKIRAIPEMQELLESIGE